MKIVVKKRYLRQSPYKIRPVLSLLKKKKVKEALLLLGLDNKKASRNIYQLLKSASSALKEKDLDPDNFYIYNLFCDQAPKLKRHKYGSRGRIKRITKRNSHITIIVSDQDSHNIKPKENSKKDN